MTTDKTIKSKNQPKQTNVTWVDLSGETPVEKHFINGRWVVISGGSKESDSEIFDEYIDATDQQRNTALANVSNQTANSTTGKMGYKVLDPTKTFAEQVTSENTIYEIRDVFDLNNGSVTIPVGSKLRFEGGRIVNGTINGNKTIIGAEPYKIFDTNTTLAGTFLNDCIYTEWFGAKADGVTDNFAVFQYVFDTSIQIGVPIQLIEGIYVIDECPVALDGQTLRINFTQDGQSFVLLGSGIDKTTIKSADGWLDRLWSKHNSGSADDNNTMKYKHLIYYYRNNNYIASMLNVSDITFDRNASSNISEPPGAYSWEGQSLLSSAGAVGFTGTSKNFIYRNLFIKDRVSSGISLGNARCDSVLIDGIISDKRIYISGVREEIYALANCQNVIIRNCNVQFIHIEPIAEQTGRRNTTIENCILDSLEWTDNNFENLLNVNGCTFNNAHMYIGGTQSSFNNCLFNYTNQAFGQVEGSDSSISGYADFNNCVFTFTPDSNFVCKKILIQNSVSRKTKVYFTNCRFSSTSISRFNMIEGFHRVNNETNEANADAVFESCRFDWNSDMTSLEGNGYIIKCFRGVDAELRNCTINRLSNTNLFWVGCTSYGKASIKINNLKVVGQYGYEKIISVYNVTSGDYIVDMDGEYSFVQLIRAYNSNSDATSNSYVKNLVLVTDNPANILAISQKAYIKGTKVKVGNLLYEYTIDKICNPSLSINDFIVTPINESMTQVEIDAINTTYLPTNSPVKVFNSTLGKYVMWYISSWVNLDGTALS